MKIAVTGASGYLGSRLSAALERSGNEVAALGRGSTPSFELARAGELEPEWRRALSGVETLVHAGWDLGRLPLSRRRSVNVEGSRTLFGAARSAGVGRIVFLSSTLARDDSRSRYGQAKREVERMLDPARDLALRIGWVFGKSAFPPALARLLAVSPWFPWPGTGRELVYCIGEEELMASVPQLVSSRETGLRFVMRREPLEPAAFVARLLGRDRARILSLRAGALREAAQSIDSLSDMRRIDVENAKLVIP
ncbi:MAG TPA: NAD-dependent epimerase/dehydratase family protein [Bdellovibrionota bacterium]|nr:NAD-dependent epimerase/dehydratase family protein [Bdellovibrionota bacterium]